MEQHPAFPLFPAGEYDTMKLRPIRYTADFRLTYADGTVEIVEIKSKFVRRMQRDYPAAAAGVLGADRPPGGVEIYRDHHRRGQRRPETLARAGKGGLNP